MHTFLYAKAIIFKKNIELKFLKIRVRNQLNMNYVKTSFDQTRGSFYKANYMDCGSKGNTCEASPKPQRSSKYMLSTP